MKRIQYVSDIHMESAAGDAFYRIPGTDRCTTVDHVNIAGPDGKPTKQELAPWLERQYSFLLLRTADPECVKDIKDAIEAELFRVELRTAIKHQKTDAPIRGHWEFDDDHALALLNATLKATTPLGPDPIFNYMPFVRSVKDMTTPEVVAVNAPANGAAAQA